MIKRIEILKNSPQHPSFRQQPSIPPASVNASMENSLPKHSSQSSFNEHIKQPHSIASLIFPGKIPSSRRNARDDEPRPSSGCERGSLTTKARFFPGKSFHQEVTSLISWFRAELLHSFSNFVGMLAGWLLSLTSSGWLAGVG